MGVIEQTSSASAIANNLSIHHFLSSEKVQESAKYCFKEYQFFQQGINLLLMMTANLIKQYIIY